MAVAGLVIGVISMILALVGIGVPFVPFGGLVLSIVGLILSVVAGKKQKSGVATAGLVIGIISIILNGIFSVTCGICTACVMCGTGSALNCAGQAAANAVSALV